MQWLTKIVDEVEKRTPKGEVLIESGGSPSGTYHFGHLREVVICDAILLELRRRGRQAKHVYYVDDLDALRKLPPNVPADFEKYLGVPLCDIPSPKGSGQSYAGYFIEGLIKACKLLGIEVEFIYTHQKYRSGFFAGAIEKTLENNDKVRQILANVSGRKVEDNWSPIQVKEGNYLKSREFLALDKDKKELIYKDADGKEQTVSYAKGEVKLNWRVDWPARWWLLNVNIEPAGRDHSTKGGSFDTGLAICKDIFGVPGPLPVQYDFINLAGDNKKMSASAGTGLDAAASAQILPPEVLRFFILQWPPLKRLYFDPVAGLVKLMDEFTELIAKPKKTNEEENLIYISTGGDKDITLSNVSFTHLVASYQSALKDEDKTLEIIRRTEGEVDEAIVKLELKYIDKWLKNWAPDDIKFELRAEIDASDFSDDEKNFLNDLATKIETAPKDADGEWFHKAIYEIKEDQGLEPNFIFPALYKAIIGKQRGPRAGWFLSILPRDWLVSRLKLEK